MKSFFSSSFAVSSALILVGAAPVPEAAPATLLDKLGGNTPTPFYRPYYETTANGFEGAPRGWGSYGLQSLDEDAAKAAGWTFDDENVRKHCDKIEVVDGFDYYCNVDDGWAVECEGDDNGIPKSDGDKFPNMKDLADYLHSKGLKMGVLAMPGAFSADSSKPVKGTDTYIGALFDPQAAKPAHCRTPFDYNRDGVQEYHDSVVAMFLEWGVDAIKLNYITPGSPGADEMPQDNSRSVEMYHKAIENNDAVGKIRIAISWSLSLEDPAWTTWQENADGLRVAESINNAGEGTKTFVSWTSVLRTIEGYRQFINNQTVEDRQGKGIKVRPDLDNLYIGNAANISGLSDVQRYTMAMHWVGAGASLLTGSDMTRLDKLGKKLLTDEAVWGKGGVAEFTQKYPMQPRNPGIFGNGQNSAQQVQAWIAGPDDDDKAVVILSNYGVDPCFKQACATFNGNTTGDQLVGIGFRALGLQSPTNATWTIDRVWGGGGKGGNDTATWATTSNSLQSNLGEGESVMYVLQKN